MHDGFRSHEHESRPCGEGEVMFGCDPSFGKPHVKVANNREGEVTCIVVFGVTKTKVDHVESVK